jgi:acetyl coenzyme A synthetase (ADP forming)-like protein
MRVDASDYRADAILRDGCSIRIRALRKDDTDLLLDYFSHLTERSVYYRFFGSDTRLSEKELARFTGLDFVNDVALVATLREEDREHIIGVVRYSAGYKAGRQKGRAEIVIAIADRQQRRGVGTVLMEHITPIAHANGITEFEADILGEDNPILQLLTAGRFKVNRSEQSGILHVSVATDETEEIHEARHRRERHAAALSLRPILNPGSVAVVGASRQAGTIGAALLSNLKRCGFKGPVYPINPKATEIDGLPAFPSVSAVGAPVDMALIAVPASLVEDAIHDCARAGVRGVVIITSGFGEISKEGREAERRLRDLCRASGMRMVGPNCMGVLNTDPEISMNGIFVPPWPPAGNIGMLSQSGALGYVILDRIEELNIGLSTFVSVGNKVDVSGNDLLAYWSEDPRTEVIVLYLESFGNPRKFARVAPEVARRKPVVAVKAGRSAAGTRAASSHSASLASLDVAVDALFEQAGVIRTATLEELMDVAVLLSTQPVPPGPRVGVISNGGGPGILLADACEARGLKLPELDPGTVHSLRQVLPSMAGLANPVDMIASATAEHYSAAIECVGRDPNIDSLIVIYLPPQLHDPEEVAAAICEAAGKVPLDKPVLTVFMSSRGAPQRLSSGPRGRLPSYSFPENAAIALAAAERYSRWRDRPEGRCLSLEPFAQAAVRAVIDRVVTRDDKPAWLGPRDLATVLRAAGVAFAPTEEVSVGHAPAASERMGYPLVLKIQAPGVLHKSDVGGVVLGLNSPQEVAEATSRLCRKMKAIGISLERVLLQREIEGGIEALVGVTTDPTFGPLLVCGLGGVLVELIKDVSFRLTPVTDVDAVEMVSRLRSARLLEGYRGSPPGDHDALIDVILRVSALVELVPELRELDLNPVKVLPPGQGAVVVDGRMRVGRA